MRLFLGDQSVVITKDFICFFEKADGCVRIVSGPSVDSMFRVRVRTPCLRCSLGELVGLRVYGLAVPSDPVGSIIVEILRVSKAGM